jgi:hypothetical protein
LKITEPYRKSRELRYLDPESGAGKALHAPMVSEIVNRLQVTELLDYWCGRAWLVQNLKLAQQCKIQCYDPAMPGFSGEALPMQMVACVDVLQDVEPECIDAVLDDLQRVTSVVGYISILQGEREPLINQDKAWWLDRIMTRFDLQTLQCTPSGFFMIVYALPNPSIDTIDTLTVQ